MSGQVNQDLDVLVDIGTDEELKREYEESKLKQVDEVKIEESDRRMSKDMMFSRKLSIHD